MDQADRPRVSVVIAAHNAASVISRALTTLSPSARAGVEVVVVDDGSTDDTGDVVSGWDAYPVRLVRQDNAGAGPARNTGARSARGQFLVFLDSDDEVCEGWHTFLLAALALPGAEIASCGVELRDHRGAVSVKRPIPMGPAFWDVSVLFLPGAYAVSRTLFHQVGGFDPLVRYGEHHELALRMAPSLAPDSVRSTSECLVVKHHDRSPTRVADYAQARLSSSTYVLAVHEEAFARDPRRASDYHSGAANSALLLSRRRMAAHHLVTALRLDPWHWRRWARLGRLLVPTG